MKATSWMNQGGLVRLAVPLQCPFFRRSASPTVVDLSCSSWGPRERHAASGGIEGQGLIPKPTRPSVRAPSSTSPGRCAAFSVRCAVSAALPGVSPSSRRLLPGFAIRRALRGCEMQQTCRTARPKLRLKPVLHISQVHAPR